jgi:hypothetical protein
MEKNLGKVKGRQMLLDGVIGCLMALEFYVDRPQMTSIEIPMQSR